MTSTHTHHHTHHHTITPSHARSHTPAQNNVDVSTATAALQLMELLDQKIVAVFHAETQAAAKCITDAVQSATPVARSAAASLASTLSASAVAALSSTQTAPGSSGAPASASAAFWSVLDQLPTTLAAITARVACLQRVLIRKRDVRSQRPVFETLNSLFTSLRPTDSTLPADAVQIDSSTMQTMGPLCGRFWVTVMVLMERELLALVERQGSLRAALETDFPKLARLLLAVRERVIAEAGDVVHAATLGSSDASISSMATGIPQPPLKGASTAVTGPSLPSLRAQRVLATRAGLLVSFESAFLGRSMKRLLEPIALTFPETGRFAPTPADTETLVRIMIGELRAVQSVVTLRDAVADNVTAALEALAKRAVEMTSSGPESMMLGASPTSVQERNIQVHNALNDVCRHLDAAEWSEIDGEARDKVLAGVNGVHAARATAVRSLLYAVESRCLDSVAAVTLSALSSSAAATLHSFGDWLHSCHASLLSRLRPSLVTREWAAQLCERLLVAFAYFTCLVRPLDQTGRMRLASDFAALEAALSPLLGMCNRRASDCGSAHVLFRQAKGILVAEMVQLGHLGKDATDARVAVMVLLHLFSRAPASMQAPHERASWLPLRFVMWLEEHSAADALQLIGASLDAYYRDAEASGATVFAETYPLMVSILRARSGPDGQS
jgi:conserved oligomeric Golgi complex subunit 5